VLLLPLTRTHKIYKSVRNNQTLTAKYDFELEALHILSWGGW